MENCREMSSIYYSFRSVQLNLDLFSFVIFSDPVSTWNHHSRMAY